jgi:FlaA1/EpsC-like NDP-sugar epimerase
MIRTLRSSNKRLLSVLVTLLLTVSSYFSAIIFLDIETHLNHLIFIYSMRIILSFVILNDIKLSWSAATARSYLKKNIIGFISFVFSLPVFFVIFRHPPIIFRMLVLELVLFLFMQNLAMFIYRFMYMNSRLKKSMSAVIYGAGKAGQKIYEELSDSAYRVDCFIDDDKKAAQRTLEGVPVLRKEKYVKLSESGGIRKKDLLVIAMPSLLDKKMIKQFYTDLSPYFHQVRILPALNDILLDQSFFTQLREIDVKDLLARHPKDLNEELIKEFIRGKKVLVTGGGGSIGSEICRQVCRFGAEQVIILDHSEYDLYLINEELKSFGRVVPVLQSVRHLEHLEKTFDKYRPQIVIHAAAYKHVPMVEYNMIEGITNNIIGTKNCIDLSIKYHVEKFVLISTDKAVRPTNVMGATKRICELYAQNMNRNGTEICAVRFGNVLGSSGSVIPKFKKQIQEGGPLTITHPDMTRYFMLIPEACQLVLQAASIGRGGEIMILDMGEPVKILDLAKSMLRLAGREDIGIEFTGLRPGEKLYEELLISEDDKRTEFESITVAPSRKYDIEILKRQIEELLVTQDMIAKLAEIVPEFTHKPNC